MQFNVMPWTSFAVDDEDHRSSCIVHNIDHGNWLSCLVPRELGFSHTSSLKQLSSSDKRASELIRVAVELQRSARLVIFDECGGTTGAPVHNAHHIGDRRVVVIDVTLSDMCG